MRRLPGELLHCKIFVDSLNGGGQNTAIKGEMHNERST